MQSHLCKVYILILGMHGVGREEIEWGSKQVKQDTRGEETGFTSWKRRERQTRETGEEKSTGRGGQLETTSHC